MLYIDVVFGLHRLFVAFFFFKQKTAYEMRISDWSSDVCSSDLRARPRGHQRSSDPDPLQRGGGVHGPSQPAWAGQESRQVPGPAGGDACRPPGQDREIRARPRPGPYLVGGMARSEEHTSDLQSLMRPSSAVFYLKKKMTYNTYHS